MDSGLGILAKWILGSLTLALVLFIFVPFTIEKGGSVLSAGLEQAQISLGVCIGSLKCDCLSKAGGENKWIWCEGLKADNKCMEVKPPRCDPSKYPADDCTRVCDPDTCTLPEKKDSIRLVASYTGCKCGTEEYAGGSLWCCTKNRVSFFQDVPCEKISSKTCDKAAGAFSERRQVGETACAVSPAGVSYNTILLCTMNGFRVHVECPSGQTCRAAEEGKAECVLPEGCPPGYAKMTALTGGELPPCNARLFQPRCDSGGHLLCTSTGTLCEKKCGIGGCGDAQGCLGAVGQDCADVCEAGSCKLSDVQKGCDCGKGQYSGGALWCCTKNGVSFLQDVPCGQNSPATCIATSPTSAPAYAVGETTCGRLIGSGYKPQDVMQCTLGSGFVPYEDCAAQGKSCTVQQQGVAQCT